MVEVSRRNLMTGVVAASAVASLAPNALVTARAAAPLAGKQNPGWYRYKVGSFEVTVVTDGLNNNPLPDTYADNAKKTTSMPRWRPIAIRRTALSSHTRRWL
jgi:hypothetical protein